MRYLLLLTLAACVHPPASGRAVVASPSANTRTIAISITKAGFEPDSVDVDTGENATFVFTRKVERTCVKRVVLALDDDHNIERDLPMGQPVAITLSFDRVGELAFACPMGMHGGAIRVRDHSHASH